VPKLEKSSGNVNFFERLLNNFQWEALYSWRSGGKSENEEKKVSLKNEKDSTFLGVGVFQRFNPLNLNSGFSLVGAVKELFVFPLEKR
jgi:hypothetical protein